LFFKRKRKEDAQSTPLKTITWNPKMEVWKMIFLFEQVIFRFHVHLPGCIWAILAYTLRPKYLYNDYVAQKKPVHTVGGRNPAHHLGSKKPVVNNWINYLSPGAEFLPSTV